MIRMPPNLRDYVDPGLRIAGAVLVIAGVVALGLATSFQGYIGALMVLTLAGCSFVGARELKAKQASAAKQPLADDPVPRDPNQDGTAIGN